MLSNSLSMYYWTIQSPVFLDDCFTLALLKPPTSPPLVSHFTEKRLRQLGENFDYIYPPTGICTSGLLSLMDWQSSHVRPVTSLIHSILTIVWPPEDITEAILPPPLSWNFLFLLNHFHQHTHRSRSMLLNSTSPDNHCLHSFVSICSKTTSKKLLSALTILSSFPLILC